MIADWDDAYANAPHIPGGDDYPPRWAAAARAFRARIGRPAARGHRLRARIRGSGSTSSCRRATPAGLVVFVHGGYWRAFDRGDWSHLAGRAAGARLGGGDAGLRAGARGADRGDHAR